MSGLDLKAVIFLTAPEVASIFRRDVDWVYKKARTGFLKGAARRFGPKMTLFLRSEIDRIVDEGLPVGGRKPRHKTPRAQTLVYPPKRSKYGDMGTIQPGLVPKRRVNDGEAE